MDTFRDWAIRPAVEGDYSQAAVYLVSSYVNEKSPQNLWRWWKRRLGKRKDYPEITQRLANAMVQEFHTGGNLFRETVAKIFSNDKKTARLPVNEFIDAIRRKRVRNFPLPEKFVPVPRPPTPPTLGGAVKKYRYPKFPVRQRDMVLIDLRKDAMELKKLLKHVIDFHTAEAAKKPDMPQVSAIVVGFYLGQRGWAMIHFDTRPEHKRDGTNYCDEEAVSIPQWNKGFEAVQKCGGTFILPDGKRLKLTKGVSCKRLVALYGGMIKTVLLDAKKSGILKKLPMQPGCQIDVEEFDGLWAWPKFEQLGKSNLA